MITLPPEVVGRALSDADFREKLFDDPKAALAELGVEATPEVIDGIGKLDREVVESFIGSLGDAVGDNAAG
ncbi:MAG: hypothetical protein KDA24_28505 [Deltaproteobacteria bacterium]|nr:hypothetical protein [Deltaproteobacteria bacterium]